MRPDDAERRRFTLGDGMVLTAATGAGLAIARVALHPRGVATPFWNVAVVLLISLSLAWTPAVLALRWRSPRPPLERLARRPGFVATLVGSVLVAVGLPGVAAAAALRGAVEAGWLGRRPVPGCDPPVDPGWWAKPLFEVGDHVGPAIVVAWVLLALSGQRRPSGDWLDNLGRLVGTVWVAFWAIRFAVHVWALRR